MIVRLILVPIDGIGIYTSTMGYLGLTENGEYVDMTIEYTVI